MFYTWSLPDNFKGIIIFLMVDTHDNIGASALGAEIMTLLAPPLMWA